MGRVNIFDKLHNYWNPQDEINRIHTLLFDINTISDMNYFLPEEYTIISFIDSVCFSEWKDANRFLDIDDFLNTMQYKTLKQNATVNPEEFISYIELCYTLYEVTKHQIEKTGMYQFYSGFVKIESIMIDCLEHYNHTAYYDEIGELVLVIEKDAAVTSVVEIEEDPEIAFEIIQYNHHTLKGDINKKKTILYRLGNQLEARRDQITGINRQLSQDIFTLLNNLNIRHNNISQGTNDYRKIVANMTPEELENWYDELYQMVLLAKLEFDNFERTKRVTALKATFAKVKETSHAETI